MTPILISRRALTRESMCALPLPLRVATAITRTAQALGKDGKCTKPVNTCDPKPTVDSGVKGRTATLKFYGDAVCHVGNPTHSPACRPPSFSLFLAKAALAGAVLSTCNRHTAWARATDTSCVTAKLSKRRGRSAGLGVAPICCAVVCGWRYPALV